MRIIWAGVNVELVLVQSKTPTYELRVNGHVEAAERAGRDWRKVEATLKAQAMARAA